MNDPEIKIWFFGICLILALIDYKKSIIPHSLVIPAIVLGIFMTGAWEWAIIMFIVGVLFYGCFYDHRYNLRISGGDVKLLAMLGAFMALKSLYIFALALLIVLTYRWLKKCWHKPLPFTPFVLVARLPFLI